MSDNPSTSAIIAAIRDLDSRLTSRIDGLQDLLVNPDRGIAVKVALLGDRQTREAVTLSSPDWQGILHSYRMMRWVGLGIGGLMLTSAYVHLAAVLNPPQRYTPAALSAPAVVAP